MTGSKVRQSWLVFLSPEAVSIAWLGVAVLLLSIELVALLAMIYAFIPFHLDGIVNKMFPLFLDQIRPEREMRFFIIFILFNCAAQAAVVFFFKHRLEDSKWRQGLVLFAAVELFWVAALAWAAFKFFVFGYPMWARVLLWTILAGALVTKIFFSELRGLLSAFFAWAQNQGQNVIVRRAGDGAVLLGIFLVVFIPDVQYALGRIYQWDQFFHIDMFVMSSALARATGAVLNVDAISLYSVVLPAIVAQLMKVMGGLSYERLLIIMMWAVSIYYALCYVVLRHWLKSIVIATIGIMCVIHMQMFQVGIWPLVWRYPSVTPMRHLFDLAVIYCVLRHAQSGRRGYVWGASAACGVMMAYMIDVGIQLTLGFYAYLFLQVVLPNDQSKKVQFKKEMLSTGGLAVLPWVTAMGVLVCFQGTSVLTPVFWRGISEYLSIFLSGWGALPVTDALKDKQFFAFTLGFVIPAVYIWTLVTTGALLWFGRWPRRDVFIIFICVYGLAAYHYYMGRSASTSYSAVIVPFIFVVCFWLNLAWKKVAQQWNVLTGFLGLLVVLSALGSNYLLTNYPNVLNLSGSNWRPEKEAYVSQLDFHKDAQMIRDCVLPSQEAALISSFETKILIEADRRPFFYYFPLVESVILSENRFRGTSMYTRPRLDETLAQLEEKKPEYIFVESKILNKQISPEFYQRFESLRTLLDYVQAHYEVNRQGQYLTALKRK